LYIQPVYIVSTGTTRIPELQRIILSMGNVVIMDASLETGMEKLQERLRQLAPQAPSEPTTPGTLPAEPPSPPLPEIRPM
jgi:uncharacterized membrane protein (UPF0182 family)